MLKPPHAQYNTTGRRDDTAAKDMVLLYPKNKEIK
jgi:hypothetical protein